MNREIHVRFWEGLGVRFPRATHSGTALKSGGRRHIALRVGRNTFGYGDPVKF